MILDVSYKSQESIENGEKKNWCALACLWMVMNYYLKEEGPTLEEIYQKYGPSLSQKEYFDTVGIEHKDILRIAREYDLRGYRRSWHVLPGAQALIDKFRADGESEKDITDWENLNVEESLFTLESMIKNQIPVILSVSKDFSPSNSTHLVVLVGVEDNYFLIHDPYQKGESYKISKEEFKKYWLKQAIFIVK